MGGTPSVIICHPSYQSVGKPMVTRGPTCEEIPTQFNRSRWSWMGIWTAPVPEDN